MTDGATPACGRVATAKDRPIHLLGLDPAERALLGIARLMFQTFSPADVGDWIAALTRAEAAFGPAQGAMIFARLARLLQCMRQSRRSVFLFNNPACPGCAAIVTEHERRLMLALVAARQGQAARAAIEVMMLCEGNEIDRVLAALDDLAIAMMGAPLDGHACAELSP